MNNTKKILFVATECVPFYKTGGIADVIRALPLQLKKKGMDARVIIPEYGIVKFEFANQLKRIADISFRFGNKTVESGVDKLETGGMVYYFIDNGYYFNSSVYKGDNEEVEQFAFFSKAVLCSIPYLDFKPDILHVHGWRTAMIPMLAKTQNFAPAVKDMKFVLSVHGLASRICCDKEFVSDHLFVADKYLQDEYADKCGKIDLLKLGIKFSDKITTVSPTYA